jgi:DNA-directed RNA polymerase specialized sigma24 family protein
MNANLPEDYYKLLIKQDWDDILLRVEAAVIRLVGSDYDADGLLPDGEEPRDVAFNAMFSVFSGERMWDPNRYPDMARFLISSVIRSKLSHAYKSCSATRVVRTQLPPLPEYSAYSESGIQVIFFGTLLAPEPAYEMDKQVEVDDLISQFVGALRGDLEARDVFMLRLEGYSNASISRILGLSIGKVRGAVERIARVAGQVSPNIERNP